MGGVYRLTELGYRLPAGPHVLPPEAFAPIEEATRLLQDAEARASAIVEEAREGYRSECARGYADGMAQGRAEALERLLREGEVLDRALGALEGELAALVSGCMRKLVSEFGDTERAEAVVRGALAKMRREKRAELRVAPAQLAHFRSVIASIVATFPDVESVDVIEDATLSPGFVVVESAIGRVEADLGSRLGELDLLIHGALAPKNEAVAS